MRHALILLAAALAGCSNADRVAYATPIPEARITAPADLVGTHRIAGIEGVELSSLSGSYAVSITADHIAVRDTCVTAGWSYRFEGDRLVTQMVAGPACRRALTPEERGLVAAFTGATKVSRTPVDGLIFEGAGGTVTLFAS